VKFLGGINYPYNAKSSPMTKPEKKDGAIIGLLNQLKNYEPEVQNEPNNT
jgi:hypothetical protein